MFFNIINKKILKKTSNLKLPNSKMLKINEKKSFVKLMKKKLK